MTAHRYRAGVKPFWKPPGGSRTLPAFLVILWGAAQTYMGVRFWLSPLQFVGWELLVTGLPLLAAGIGLWQNRNWARWPALACLTVMFIFRAEGTFTHPITLRSTLMLASLAYTAGLVLVCFSPQRRPAGKPQSSEDDEGGPLISLVLLLRKSRYLDAKILASYLESAWGGHYTVVDSLSPAAAAGSPKEPPRLVASKPPILFVASPEGLFIVHNRNRPYGSNDGRRITPELRAAQAIEEQRAWIAVDLMRTPDPQADPHSAYPAIARLIAELSGPDCLAIYRPETNQFNVWDDSLEEKLRNPNALELFETPTFAPVISIEKSDPRMVEAALLARERWPEFADAFAQLAGEDFMIKAPLSEGGNTEFIWIEVDYLDAKQAKGRLANDPMNLGKLKLGSTVTVPLDTLNDWMFIRDGKPVGLFTPAVLAAKGKER